MYKYFEYRITNISETPRGQPLRNQKNRKSKKIRIVKIICEYKINDISKTECSELVLKRTAESDHERIHERIIESNTNYHIFKFCLWQLN